MLLLVHLPPYRCSLSFARLPLACRACRAALVWVRGAGWVLVGGGGVVSWALWVGDLGGPPCIPRPWCSSGSQLVARPARVVGITSSPSNAAAGSMRAPRVKVVGRPPMKRKDAAYLAAVGTIRGAQGGARRALKQLRGGWVARTRAWRRAFASGIARFGGPFLEPLWAPRMDHF